MAGFSDLVLGIGKMDVGRDAKVADVIAFVESPWGLGGGNSPIKLFPVQRVMLKAHYGLELDDKEEFDLSDWRRASSRKFTEASYLKYLFNEGRSNIKEVIPGQERREMVLSVGRRSGKCVVGDTLIPTDKGLFRIDELGDPAGVEYQPVSVIVAQEGTRRALAAVFYNGGVRDTFRVSSRCGYAVEGTANHRIKVLATDGTIQWRYLSEVQSSDYLAVHRTASLWAAEMPKVSHLHSVAGTDRTLQPDFIDPKWGLLIGYLVGDGSWTSKSMVAVTVEHPETWIELKGLFQDLFGRYGITMDKRTENTGRIQLCSQAMREFLHRLGFRLDVACDMKSTPWIVLRSPRPVVQAYLQGLFETDGGVESAGKVVSFCTASCRLAQETQLLLLNFGIVSRVRAKHNSEYDRDYYVLTLRGLRSRRQFASEIGFRSHKKQDALLAGLKAAREGGDTESIPHQIQWVRRLLASVPEGEKGKKGAGRGANWIRSKAYDAFSTVYKPSYKGINLTYSRLVKGVDLAESLGADPVLVQHFREVGNPDYFFDPVVVVTQGRQLVYDLSVPDGESFVGNGLTNHNTTIAAIIAAYETYKLILKGHPQAYYGLPATNQIQIVSVATDQKQAALLYGEVSGHFRNCQIFQPYMANNTMSYARFQTPKDIERYGRYSEDPKANASIYVSFRSCIAKGLRGAGNIVVILDEVAHFTDDGQSSAEMVYNAVTPSTSAFSPKDPQDSRVPIGPVEGRIISISSPLGRQGQFYKLFQIGMKGGVASENMLCIQAPTWEVNPTIPASEFEKHYLKDPVNFFTEYGGEFTDRTRGWIEREEVLTLCIDSAARPLTVGISRQAHYVGIDVGLAGDGSAIAIGHIDREDRIVLDYLGHIKAGEGRYSDLERLDFDGVADWVQDFGRRFYLAEGMFDHWAGIPFEQALHKRGFRQLKSVQQTAPKISDMFRNFKDMLYDGRLSLYNWPLVSGQRFCDYIQELLELQAEVRSRYITDVHAPKVDGKHDDRSDALVRMVWIASQHLTKPKYICRRLPNIIPSTMNVNMTPATRPEPGAMRRMFMRAKRMGSSPDRQASRHSPNKILRRK